MESSVKSAKQTRRERLEALGEDHQNGIRRFQHRIMRFIEQGLLNPPQADVIIEHLLRLGERNRNPANTGNIEDLFCYTLEDTRDAVRAFAQALADSVKVVPMDDEARLRPALRSLETGRIYERVGELDHLSPGDKMLVAHTMVAYGDEEMWESAAQLVRVTRPELAEQEVEREVAIMAVQSQHLPSSTFVLARAKGLTIVCDALYRDAGYDDGQVADAQSFYDICAEFSGAWAAEFLEGRVPETADWKTWRARYIKARAKLPPELIYQLCSDTLTNFLDGTMESGKWTDAAVFFAGISEPESIPHQIARIVNQYIAEHEALHDRPARELSTACAAPLRPWGIGFENDRAIVIDERPEKAEALRAQFDAAWSRKKRNSSDLP